MVFAAGLTVWAPPFAESVKLLPSEPVRVTAVAWVAVTVSVNESPAVIEPRLATIITVAAGWATVTAVVADAAPPGPVALAV